MSGSTADAKNSVNEQVEMYDQGDVNGLLNDAISEMNGEFDGIRESDQDTASAEDSEEREFGDEEEGDESETEEGDESEEAGEEGDPEDDGEEAASVLVVPLTDEHGRRELRLDLVKDKDKIVRYVQQAAGARKLSVAKSRLEKELSDTKAEMEQLAPEVSAYRKLDQLYKEGGVEAVIEQLTGESIEQYDARRDQFREAYKKMSPEEQMAYRQKRIEERAQRQIAEAKKEAERLKLEMEEREINAQVAQLESWAHPRLTAYSFKGKLGDAAREQKLDTRLFQAVQSELTAREKAGEEITRELVEEVIDAEASLLGAVIESRANKKAQEKIDTKKRKAQEAAQASVRRSVRTETPKGRKSRDYNPTNVDDMSLLLATAAGGGRRRR